MRQPRVKIWRFARFFGLMAQIMDSEEHGSRAPERRQDKRRDHPLRDAAPVPEVRLSRAGGTMCVNEK